MSFPREGKVTSSHFLASKDVMGWIRIRYVSKPVLIRIRFPF